MIDCNFIAEYDTYISSCILRYARPPIDDFKQDIYLKLHEHTFHNGNIKAYICKIVQNYFFSIYRKQKVISKDKFEIGVTNSPELHLIYKDVLHAIDELPHGECLKLYSYGFKYREIAQKLHISMSSVKSSIYRIRHRLNGSSISKKNVG